MYTSVILLKIYLKNRVAENIKNKYMIAIFRVVYDLETPCLYFDGYLPASGVYPGQ